MEMLENFVVTNRILPRELFKYFSEPHNTGILTIIGPRPIVCFELSVTASSPSFPNCATIRVSRRWTSGESRMLGDDKEQ